MKEQIEYTYVCDVCGKRFPSVEGEDTYRIATEHENICLKQKQCRELYGVELPLEILERFGENLKLKWYNWEKHQEPKKRDTVIVIKEWEAVATQPVAHGDDLV